MQKGGVETRAELCADSGASRVIFEVAQRPMKRLLTLGTRLYNDHHSHKTSLPFYIDELTTRAFGTAFVPPALGLQLIGGCAPKPLPEDFTQYLILLLNTMSHTLPQPHSSLVYIT
jgi:hypothetical protein